MTAAPMQAYAQAGPAVSFGQKIAEKVLTSILGAAAGKAFSAIFGSEPHQLTIQDLDNALTNAFDNAAVKNVGSQKGSLYDQVIDYNSDWSDADRKLAIQDIMTASGGMRSYIDSHINKNTSMKMIPAFVMAWNMRLAFAAERYGINKIKTDKEKVALYAVQGLEYLEKYMREEFFDPHRGDIKCVQKAPSTALRINGAIGLNWTEKGIDVSRQYCLGNGRVLKKGVADRFLKKFDKRSIEMMRMSMGISDEMVLNLNGSYYMLSTDVGKAMHENVWLYAAKRYKSANRHEYWLYEASSLERANVHRNGINLTHYEHGAFNSWLNNKMRG